MSRLNLQDINEEYLLSLEQNKIPESLTLEFKRELNLDNREDKAEAAKDISAMANTAGGRIFFGIDEKSLPDGSKVAGPIYPLTDGTIDSRLEDVILSSIHPRPRFRTHKILLTSTEGFVLAVEVYPAYSSDLHMVTGFKESRFYHRGEQRTILMTEPEVRECYMRIAASRQTLDAAMEKAISSELSLVPSTQESVLVIPWFGHRNLVNPQRFGAIFWEDIASSNIIKGGWISTIKYLKVFTDGYRGYEPPNIPLNECFSYACIQRTGLVHFAHILEGLQKQSTNTSINLVWTLDILVAALVTARYVLDTCAYWGPVRVIHRLNIGFPFYLEDPHKGMDYEFNIYKQPVSPGIYTHTVPEVNLVEQGGSIKLILRELLHQIFQTNGEAACPWFDESGEVKQEMGNFLREDLFKQLRD
jgi:hypothetical protein